MAESHHIENKQTMLERKSTRILFLSIKKLLILQLVWKTNRRLQYESLFFIVQFILMSITHKKDRIPAFLRRNLKTEDI